MNAKFDVQIPFRVATLFLGALPASLLSVAPILFLLIPGLMNLHILGVLWGVASLAGTVGLWRVVFDAADKRKTVLCLLAGILAFLPLIVWGEIWLVWMVLPFYAGLVNILWIGILALRNCKQPK